MDRKTLEALGLDKDKIDLVLDKLHEELSSSKHELSNQIELNKKLQEDLKAKDNDISMISEKAKTFEETQVALSELKSKYESQAKAHQDQLDSIEFDNLLNGTISSFKGKNAKAISALLDIDNLKSSKNRVEDVKKAMESLSNSEDSSFLFGDIEAKVVASTNLIGATTGNAPSGKREVPAFF